MYPKTLYPKTKQVLDKIKSESILKDFYLAGGTALSLQLGHRKSIDLDFFSDKFPKRDLLLQAFQKYSPKIIQEAPGTLDLMIDEVKTSFLEYKYPLVESLVDFEGTKIASVADIACMKLSAISSRGNKKDFIDLYFVLKKKSLLDLIAAFEKKFQGVDYQTLHLLKALVYFTDANADPDPDYLEHIEWEEVKNKLEEKVKKLLEL